MVFGSRSYFTSCILAFSYVILLGILLSLGKVYAKDPVEIIIKKHIVDVEKYKIEANVKELMFKLIVINRDIGEYYQKGYDYKKDNIFKVINSFFDDYNLEYPDAKLSEEYIRNYKKDLKMVMNRLPADFFFNVVLGYEVCFAHVDSNYDHMSIHPYDSLDIGMTAAIIGTVLAVLPNPYCRAIGGTLAAWGINETYHNVQQIRIERKKQEKERRKREQRKQQGRDCSQCSKKCRDCPYCRKRQGW